MRRLLVLWDIDYTLVNARGVGSELYTKVFTGLYGRPLPQPGSMAGRTDRAIAREVLALAGLDGHDGTDGLDQQLLVFQAALNDTAPAFAARARQVVTALPGAGAALAGLAAVAPGQGPVQSLLTGNIRPMAEIKLAAAGLTCHLDLEVGSYGDQHEIRAELVAPARAAAAAAYGQDFGGTATVLIGDTPLDVAAALATGARAVGVATGHFSAADLAAAGAHAVLPDLTGTAAVVSAILG
ncbi:MAG TPA: haloacid dehalogenase-like hydrolase [Streptosporangiaceae bacterium]|nr:haloacid dehalogenase-like hydrolase [Streptosporangiaceae bacterium]